MKQLSEVLKNTSLTPTQAEQKPSTPQHGSTSVAGLMNIRPIIPFHKAETLPTEDLERNQMDLLKRLSTCLITSKEAGIYRKGTDNQDYFLRTARQVNITHLGEDDAAKLKASLRAFLVPASEEFIMEKLVFLRSSTAMQKRDMQDSQLRLAAYVAQLRHYPEHAISYAVKELITGGWFPDKIQDFHDIIEQRLALSQSLLRQLENKKYLPPIPKTEASMTAENNAPQKPKLSIFEEECLRKPWKGKPFAEWTDDDKRAALADAKANIVGWKESVAKNIPSAKFFLEQAESEYTDLETKIGRINGQD